MTLENPTDSQEQVSPPEHSPTELKALEQGWKPKEEFQGDEHDFIDAGEFVRRGELFSKIEKQSKELKQVREALDALKQHQGKVEEAGFQRALKQLETARKQALIDGDTEKFFALEEQMDGIKAEKSVVEANSKVSVAQEPPALVDWKQKNSWYQTNRAMTALADRLGTEYRQRGFTIEQALKEIDAEVRKDFPEKFESRKRPPSPEGSTRTGNSSSKSEQIVLSDDERRIMRKFVQSKVMTEAEYLKELKRVKE